ncbi:MULTISPECIES: sugar ABC transporter substrate-binding protein [Streptomyces]|uniref:Substrate-binding domain-containing protein n=1 Tax=Streptomyces doudnae TaxID=3075536 RepID=A0ABD5EHV5_9ACTN|nr:MULTISPECIES: substrate-binding domain-containing protein [unclassified Streptomyces]MDT0433984.1 substrate-binding domain-containing protein [Streptomyces sp. DSM 41981]SCD77863.1 D-xylose transport system substrate-binding protein [Streptomyces sp. SolWspMP-5a-2]
MNSCTTRRSSTPRIAAALTASASALLLTACGAIESVAGSDSSATPEKTNDITVGLLLPDRDTARFEKFDHPLIEKHVASLTAGKGKVVYANAGASADKQSEQMQQMIDGEADVILVDAVDAKAIAPAVRKAKDAGIPVIAYDRLAEGPISGYVSHDNELVGEVQGRALVDALGDDAEKSRTVMLNGSPADPNTARFKAGALGELKDRVDIAKTYDTREWLPQVAEANMKKAIAALGADRIAAVYAANDGIAGAAIGALKAAGVIKMPPVTGQDADLAAVRRIVAGDQYMTVYKPFLQEATDAAELAVAKVRGSELRFDALSQDSVDSPTDKDIPARLVPVVALTKDNIEETVVRDGVYTAEEICAGAYADACAAIGLK